MHIYIIIVVVVVILVICIIENTYYKSKIKQVFKCPNEFDVYDLDLDGVKDSILIYDVRSFNTKARDITKYKYTYKPKILFSSRVVKPLKDSLDVFKQFDKDSMLTDTVEGVLPIINYTDKLIGAESNYRVLSNLPNLKITSNEDYIYIK